MVPTSNVIPGGSFDAIDSKNCEVARRIQFQPKLIHATASKGDMDPNCLIGAIHCARGI
jgi:hypothetical protein